MKTRTKIIAGVVVALVVIVAVVSVVVGTVGNMSQQESVSMMGKSEFVGNGDELAVSDYSVQVPGSAMSEEAAPAPLAQENTASDKKAGTQNRMIVRSGDLSIVTKDVRKSVEEVATYVASAGGFVVSSNIEGTADAPSARVEVRVPVEKFQQSIDSIKKAGIRVTEESINGEDVTEDYTDTQANIKNLQASEAQFQEIMKQAVKVSDVLEVQRQLERVRGEIDIAQGHAQYLEKSAKLSSITAYFAIDEGQLPVIDPINEWNPLTIIKSAFRAFVGFAQWIGAFIIWLIVFIPVWIIIAAIIIFIKKRAKKPVAVDVSQLRKTK